MFADAFCSLTQQPLYSRTMTAEPHTAEHRFADCRCFERFERRQRKAPAMLKCAELFTIKREKCFQKSFPLPSGIASARVLRRSGLALRFCLIFNKPRYPATQSAPRHSDSSSYDVWLPAPSVFSPFSAQGSGRRRTLELSGNTKPSEGLPLAARDRHKTMITELSHFLHQWFLNRLQAAMPE